MRASPEPFPSKSWAECWFPGRLPGFRVIAASSAFPSRFTTQWLALWAERGLGSPITVAGPRPICTAFPFVPDSSSGSPQEPSFQRTTSREDGTTSRREVSSQRRIGIAFEPIQEGLGQSLSRRSHRREASRAAARARLGLAKSAPSRRVSSRLSCPGYNPTDSPRLTCATITPAPIQNTTRWRSQ